jgi:hypothetical protein
MDYVLLQAWWYMSVISATWEAEAGGRASLGKVSNTQYFIK